MKRRNVDYEYETNREKVVNVDFEQLMKEFDKDSRERRRCKKIKKNHKR